MRVRYWRLKALLTENHSNPKIRIANNLDQFRMSSKEPTYKVNLSGGSVTVKDQPVSESVALKIIALVMGGNLDIDTLAAAPSPISGPGQGTEDASGASLNPKAFMAQKKPTSEIERITCLAYYLTHYRNTKAFKTRDLTKLNTEAAQPSFSNAAVFTRNADTAGYLSKAGGGTKQITYLGETVVKALPNREDVKSAIANNRVRSKRRTTKKSRKKTQ